MPSALHGVRCMGMPPTRLKAFRTTVGRCLPGKHAGRSLTWRLAMIRHTRAGWSPSWHGQRRSGTSSWTTLICTGPGGDHHTTFVKANGHEIDLRQICPRDVKAQAMVDSELALWKDWAGDSDERKELLPCPLLEPAIRANKRAQRRQQEAPATKAVLGVIQSGWWTQEVAHKAGISLSPFCLNCGPGVLGSAQHRLWACPAYRETRMNLPPTHQPQGQTATGDKLKWERGLMHDPVEKYTPGRTHDGKIHVWIHPSVVGNSLGGKLFVDGSLLCKYGSQGGQAGWAVTQIHETSHELVCSAHGAMPISLPVQRRILRAELWALWQAIILSELGATFVSDCATVLRGLERGPKWCTAARRPHADVWRRIWDSFRDIGEEAHVDSVAKCKAHLSKTERAKLDETGRFVAAGNERADELAKEGARDDSFQSILYDTYKGAVETCKAIITYIGSFILQAKGGERWPDVAAPPLGWDEKDERWKHAQPILAHPHVLRCRGRQWFCEVCDKRASGGAAKSKLARTECMGHPATALGQHARPQCHLLAQTGSYVWCCRCGARAAKFAKKLGEPCVGHPRSQEYA